SRTARAAAIALPRALLAGSAMAARVAVDIDGVDGELREAVLAAIELQQYEDREVSKAQARRLYRRAEGQIQEALEPYGYYGVTVNGELLEEGENFRAVFVVTPGDPVTIGKLDIRIDDSEAAELRPVRAAVNAFSPQKDQRLDHASYERSKAAIHASLFSVGYLDAELVVHRVEVERAANTAKVMLEWKVGNRYRFAETDFEGGQFPEDFMQRYIPWDAGDYYSQDKLLELQQRLFDTNYFAISQVQPDTDHAADGRVPIAVTLAPAKRT